VFLKQISAGLLLVAGSHKVNGVPLKRVNQASVLATGTIFNLPGVRLPEVNEALFKKTQEEMKASREDINDHRGG
jgi:large subunit ribosomal protein L6e